VAWYECGLSTEWPAYNSVRRVREELRFLEDLESGYVIALHRPNFKLHVNNDVGACGLRVP
jgi:hypothetical protein